MRYVATAFSLILIAGCTKTVTEERIVYQDVPVPVPVGCVVNRPTEPDPLRARYTDAQWAALAPGARAQAIAAQAGDRLNHTQAQAAALSGCKDAPKP